MPTPLTEPDMAGATALEPRTAEDHDLLVDDVILSRGRISFSWLLRLRWAAVVGQLVTVFFVYFALEIDLPLLPLLVLVGAAAASNAGFVMWFRRQLRSLRWHPRGTWLMGGIMILDVLLLTAMLYVSGGPSNPFSIFYLVHLALAATMLRRSWAYSVGAVAIGCFALLFSFHTPLEALGNLTVASFSLSPSTATPVELYLAGILVAFGTSATIVVYFIIRVSTELGRRERDLRRVRLERARTEKLEALATLSAGAAHELASPLSTIAVVAKDLQIQLETGAPLDDAVEDARLIRGEVDRCRKILDQMAAEAGQSKGEGLEKVEFGRLIERVLEGLPDSSQVELTCLDATRLRVLFAPPGPLARAIRAIVKNAVDASTASSKVSVTCSVSADTLRLEIADHGAGMSPEVVARAGNPFFTTKEPGSGMGLGLFLSRTVVENLGGRLDIESIEGTGTRVRIVLPLVD